MKTATQGDGNQSPRGTHGPRYRQVCGLLISAGAFVVALGAACTDTDHTAINTPDSGVSNGGSGGSAGAGGSGANGGSAGSANAGASGTGGDQPDASAGSGGTGGSGGNDAGTDAGLDAGGSSNNDAGDAAPVVLTHEQVATAICAREDEVDNCPDTTDCVTSLLGSWDFFQNQDYFPGCSGTVEDYYRCIGGEPVTSFDCNTQTDPNAPEATTPQPGACVDEDAAFQAGIFGDPSNCTH